MSANAQFNAFEAVTVDWDTQSNSLVFEPNPQSLVSIDFLNMAHPAPERRESS